MTFKHVKFEDSPTMRALEKVAKEKGLVKPESLQKRASIPKKADYTPSSDFMENIFKLCAGLRTQGLESEASELEVNYLNYKRAQTLYETSKETGEDLVQSAHPKGSHKLEGVDSDEATVEDILEQHMKMIQVIEKKPHGKLSTARAINEVKKVLGQGAAPQESESELNKKIDATLASMPRQFGGIVFNVNTYGDSEWATIDKDNSKTKAAEVTNSLSQRPFNRANYNALSKAFSDFTSWASDTGSFEDSIWHSGVHNEQSKKLWAEHVAPSVGQFKALMTQLNDLLVKRDNVRVSTEQGNYDSPDQPAKVITLPTQTIVSDPLIVKLEGLVSRLKSFLGVLSIARDPEAKKWIEDEIKEISAMEDRIDDVAENQPAQRKSMDARYQQDASTFENEVNQFQKDWVDAQ